MKIPTISGMCSRHGGSLECSDFFFSRTSVRWCIDSQLPLVHDFSQHRGSKHDYDYGKEVMAELLGVKIVVRHHNC